MKEKFINPFEEVEKGIKDWELPSSHIYWENYVKLNKINYALRMEEKANNLKNDIYLFQREFSKNDDYESIIKKVNKLKSQCYGACNSLFYRCKQPSGVLI